MLCAIFLQRRAALGPQLLERDRALGFAGQQNPLQSRQWLAARGVDERLHALRIFR